MKSNTILTIMDFEKICNELKPMSYIFNTDNQEPVDYKQQTFRISITFDNLLITKNPNRICLTLGEKNFFGKYENYIRFERVKHIIYKGKSAGFRFFTIVCGNIMDDLENVEYSLSII